MSPATGQSETATPTAVRSASWLTYLAIIIGAAVALVGAGHLVAWLSGYMAGRGFDVLTMKTNTALVLLLAGLGLVLLSPSLVGSARRWISRGLAALAALIGLLSLSENLMGWDLGIDQLLAREPSGALGVAAPNLMGTPAAASFFLAGLALLILSRRAGRRLQTAQVLALAVCLLALLGTLGYLYDVQALHAIVRVTGIAWPTAVTLLMLGLGLLLARPTQGLMRQVTADDPGGANLRRWLPVLLLPVVLGWVRLHGERHGWFDAATGTAMMMITFIVAMCILAYTAARPVSQSSAALRRQREWLQVTLTSIGDAVIATDTAGQITFLNPVAEVLTGWQEQEALGRSVYEVFRIINEETRQPADDIVARVLRAGVVVALANHTAIQTRDGREIPIEDSAAPIKDAAGNVTGVVLVFHDVAQKRRTQEALAESRERLDMALRSARMATFDWDIVQNKRTWDDGVHHLFGTSPESFTGAAEEFFRIIHPDDRSTVRAALSKAVESTAPYETEYRALWPDGSIRYIAARGKVHRDPAGRAVRMTGICWDITEHKQADAALHKTVEELERSNKELEQFAYISSHDLQEPLRQVRAFVQLLRERHQDKLDGEAAEYMGFVSEGAARMSDLVRGLLDYSRVGAQDARHEAIPCQRALDVALANLQASIDESQARITYDELPTISLEPTQLTQLFQNLIGNALKFRRDGAPPEIHVGVRREADHWLFLVKDNGIGIASQYQQKVFLIFQRLHDRDKYPGTGIGLAICKKIVEQRGGRIWIESRPGEGSTFYFTLPEGGRA